MRPFAAGALFRARRYSLNVPSFGDDGCLKGTAAMREPSTRDSTESIPKGSRPITARLGWVVVVVSAAMLVGALEIARFRSASLTHEPPPAGVSTGEYQLATESFELKYGRKADRLDVLSWLAEWYLGRDRLPLAVDCFAAIPTAHPQYGRMARYQQGRTLLELNRAVESEQQLRELISLEEASPTIKPGYLVDARQRLRHLLEVSLRFEERQQLLRGVVARGEADHFELLVFCFPSHLRWNGPTAVQWLERFQATAPTDPVLNVALGRYRAGQGRLDEARQILETVVRERPEDRLALAALLACLRDADSSDEWSRRITALPPQLPDDPWLLLIQRGVFANQNGRPEIAAEAFQQLLSHDRTCTEAWTGLAESMLLLNDPVRRQQALKMIAGLGRIQNNLSKVNLHPASPDGYVYVADLCAEISLDQEGLLLAQYAEKLAPEHERVRAMRKLFQFRLAALRAGDSGKP